MAVGAIVNFLGVPFTIVQALIAASGMKFEEGVKNMRLILEVKVEYEQLRLQEKY